MCGRPVDQGQSSVDGVRAGPVGVGTQASQDPNPVGHGPRGRIERHKKDTALAGSDRFAVRDGYLPGPPGGGGVVRDPGEGLAHRIVADTQAHDESSLRW